MKIKTLFLSDERPTIILIAVETKQQDAGDVIPVPGDDEPIKGRERLGECPSTIQQPITHGIG
jgi:hypothetical protein